MRSPQPSTVVIACPYCGTRYQVPHETLGNRGRKVSCAHCGKAWMAEAPMPAEDDRLFTPTEEEALDREFKALEQRAAIAEVPGSLKRLMPADVPPPPEVVKSIAEIKAAIAPKVEEPAPPAPEEPKPTPAAEAAKGKLEKRQRAFGKALPAARLFRIVRIGAVVLLVMAVAGGIWLRTEIVKLVPDMAGVYSALGLGVNVVGLEFSDVTTLMTRRADSAVVSVSAKIRSVERRRVVVPPVVVSLLDTHGTSLYQWSVVPDAGDVEPGETIDFSAELTAPPEGAAQVKLGFANGRPQEVAATPIAQPDIAETQH